MGRKALLVGLNVYSYMDDESVSPALQNLKALKQVLHSDIGQFPEDAVETLINPDAQQIRQAIERLSSHCRPNDLRLFYFCGLGLIDLPTGGLYLTGYDTHPLNPMATAVSGDLLRGMLSASHCRQQITIFDARWAVVGADVSEALGSGHTNRLVAQLAGEYRAVLMAQNGFNSGWSRTAAGLSDYTHCLIEGVDSGLADLGADGFVSIADLHQYVEQSLDQLKSPVQAALYAPGRSADVQLFQLPQFKPEQEYRRSVEDYATQGQGNISEQGRQILIFLQQNLGIPGDVGQAIEADVLRPYRERQERLQHYEKIFAEAIQLENPPRKSMRRWLRHQQQTLGLTYEEVSQVEARLIAPNTLPFSRQPQRLEPPRIEPPGVKVAPMESDRTGTVG
ncbi:MAG: caspase family protein [Cyanobacteria bacterium Co-bin13]|nr:caspase family protein [Cyanobacteria bacterium Co-bin13]